MSTPNRPDDARRLVLGIDVALAPSLLPPVAHPAIYIVVDVLRATSTLSVLFDRGCARVRVVRTVDEARALRAGGVPGLLVGEVGGLRPEGFDLGNSPREMDATTIAGQEVIFATTNGTRAIHACVNPEADAIFAGSFRNATTVAEAAVNVFWRVARAQVERAEQGDSSTSATGEHPEFPVRQDDVANVVIVCAGLHGRPALDDTLCAGYLAERVAAVAVAGGCTMRLLQGAEIARLAYGDARATVSFDAVFMEAPAARALARVGLGGDVAECARIDVSRSVPAVVLPAAEGQPLLMRASDGS